MKLSTLLIFPLALAVTGCMQNAPIKQPPDTVSFKDNTAANRVVGYTEPEIRTFVPAEITEELKQQYDAHPNTRPAGI